MDCRVMGSLTVSSATTTTTAMEFQTTWMMTAVCRLEGLGFTFFKIWNTHNFVVWIPHSVYGTGFQGLNTPFFQRIISCFLHIVALLRRSTPRNTPKPLTDSDGILDEIEQQGDPDGDGRLNYLDDDSDGDGAKDWQETDAIPSGRQAPISLHSPRPSPHPA